jgi:urease accessory protein
MTIINAPVSVLDPALPVILLRADRQTLAKRLWRGVASDGADFGFELEAPLKHGEAFFANGAARYVIEQVPEPVVEVSLELTPAAAAGIGWAVGNLHLELSAEPTRMLAPDEPAVRQLLERLKVPYRATEAVFRPGRFARGNLPTHDLGPSHKH